MVEFSLLHNWCSPIEEGLNEEYEDKPCKIKLLLENRDGTKFGFFPFTYIIYIYTYLIMSSSSGSSAIESTDSLFLRTTFVSS